MGERVSTVTQEGLDFMKEFMDYKFLKSFKDLNDRYLDKYGVNFYTTEFMETIMKDSTRIHLKSHYTDMDRFVELIYRRLEDLYISSGFPVDDLKLSPESKYTDNLSVVKSCISKGLIYSDQDYNYRFLSKLSDIKNDRNSVEHSWVSDNGKRLNSMLEMNTRLYKFIWYNRDLLDRLASNNMSKSKAFV